MNNDYRDKVIFGETDAPPLVQQKARERDMSDENQLKVEINNFVWMHAPGMLTLEQADDIACKMWAAFIEGTRGTLDACEPPGPPETML